MATNPQAEGQTKISFQISEAEKADLQRLADRSGMKLSAYIRKVLENAIMSPIVFKVVYDFPVIDEAQLGMVAEDQSTYGARNVGRVETDHERRVTSVNDAMLAICGHPREQMMGKRLGEILQGALTEPAAVAKIRAALDKRREITTEITNYHADGHPYRVRLAIRPTPTGFVGETHLLP